MDGRRSLTADASWTPETVSGILKGPAMKAYKLALLLAFAVLPLTRDGFAADITKANAIAAGSARDISLPPPDFGGVGYVKAPAAVVGGFNGVQQTSGDDVTSGKARATSEASAHANIGDLGVEVFGFSSVDAGAGNVEIRANAGASALASWTDLATVRTRTPRRLNVLNVTFALFLDGNLDTGAGGTSGASVSLLLRDLNLQATLPGSPYNDGTWGFAQTFPGTTINNPIPDAIRLNRSVTASQPFTLGFEMKLEANSEATFIPNLSAGSGFATFTGDVSGSLHWGGIESVFDIDGNPVDDWTIESESGFDYSRPFGVPDPSGIVLAATALATALGVTQMRRRRLDDFPPRS